MFDQEANDEKSDYFRDIVDAKKLNMKEFFEKLIEYKEVEYYGYIRYNETNYITCIIRHGKLFSVPIVRYYIDEPDLSKYNCKNAKNIYREFNNGKYELPKADDTDFDTNFVEQFNQDSWQYIYTTDIENLVGCGKHKIYNLPNLIFDGNKKITSNYNTKRIIDVQSKIMSIIGYNNVILNNVRPDFTVLSPNEGIHNILNILLINFAYFNTEFTKDEFQKYVLNCKYLIDDEHEEIESNQDWYNKFDVKIPRKMLIDSIRKFCLNITNDNLFGVINNILKSDLRPPRDCDIKTII
jgi:hypothetical protein